jgi:hypothetical protein
MPNDTRGRLDSAIDRAVRGMMQVDPAPGLRVRVAGRLERAPSRSAVRWSFASAAALVVVVLACIALFRALRFDTRTEPAVRPASRITTVQPRRDVAPPAPLAAAPSAATPRGRAAAGEPVRALPRPSVIFSGSRDRVRAASVSSETISATRDAPMTPLPEVFAPISPIVIVPISITPIVVQPLTVPPLSDRK